jgi:two-component system, LytTR family, sensor kinase
MEILIQTVEKASVLVTLMFALGCTGFVARLTVRPARQDALLALAFFLLMALTEVWIAKYQHALLNACFAAVCAAGLIAGPWIGTAVGAATGMAVLALEPRAHAWYARSMAGAGLASGLVRQFWPAQAIHPGFGFAFVTVISMVRYELGRASGSAAAARTRWLSCDGV